MTRKLTRRALMAGIAASPVAAIPAFASPAASGDAELLRLESELALAGAEFNRIDEARVEALGKLPEWARLSTPKYPIGHPLFRNMGRSYADSGDCLTIKAIRDFNRNTKSIVEDWRHMAASPVRDKRRAEWLNRRAEGRKRVTWWHDQAAAIEAENVRAGTRCTVPSGPRASNSSGMSSIIDLSDQCGTILNAAAASMAPHEKAASDPSPLRTAAICKGVEILTLCDVKNIWAR
jgi:hypothetical protein